MNRLELAPGPVITVVFAGSMPTGDLLDNCVSIIAECKNRGRSVVIDVSANALKKIIDLGGIDIIKPNVQKLCELLGQKPKLGRRG